MNMWSQLMADWITTYAALYDAAFQKL